MKIEGASRYGVRAVQFDVGARHEEAETREMNDALLKMHRSGELRIDMGDLIVLGLPPAFAAEGIDFFLKRGVRELPVVDAELRGDSEAFVEIRLFLCNVTLRRQPQWWNGKNELRPSANRYCRSSRRQLRQNPYAGRWDCRRSAA